MLYDIAHSRHGAVVRVARRGGKPALAAAALLYGCGPSQDSGERLARTPSPPPREPAAVDTGVGTLLDARPAALVNGRAVPWSEMRPLLNEAAGAAALQEIVLNRMIHEELAARTIVITADDVAAERRRLLETLSSDPSTAIRLLERLRAADGLGRTRFEQLMRRNAGLRALVRDRAEVTEEAVRQMHDVRYGPRRQARLMVLPDRAQAQAAFDRVRQGEPFADVAVDLSTDSSAPRGGLLEPISRDDPSYPESLRQTLWSLQPGELSIPVLIEGGFAVLLLEREVPATGVALEDARPELEKLVRTGQERLLMDQLARRMLGGAAVTIFDESLNESWSRRAGRE
jgi:parvulin-like peptidyl-prolyl isomerase